MVGILDIHVVKTQVEQHTIDDGCSQEGVISLLICSLVVDGLLTKLTKVGISYQAYAEDIVILKLTKRRKFGFTHVHMSGVEVKQGKEVKHLEVIVDSKFLRYNSRHVEKVTKKATSSIMVCRRLTDKS